MACSYDDCVSDNPPLVDLDEFMQWSLDVESVALSVVVAPTEPQEGLQELMSDDLRRFCKEKGVEPRVRSDIEILDRAMAEGFAGKKLEKALYKVRHRDEYRKQKARNKARNKARRIIQGYSQ